MLKTDPKDILRIYDKMPRYKSSKIVTKVKPEVDITTEESDTKTEEEQKVANEKHQPVGTSVVGAQKYDPTKRWGTAEGVASNEFETAEGVSYTLNDDNTVQIGNSKYQYGEHYDDTPYRYAGEPLRINSISMEDDGFLNALLDAQIKQESYGIPGIKSGAGAGGLGQFTDIGWNEALRQGWVSKEDSRYDPGASLRAQKGMMKYLYNTKAIANAPSVKERVARTLAAYNWGIGRVEKALKKYDSDWRNHIPEETSTYLENIFSDLGQRIKPGEYTPIYIR